MNDDYEWIGMVLQVLIFIGGLSMVMWFLDNVNRIANALEVLSGK